MSETTNTATIREAINSVVISGYLKKKELRTGKNDKGDYISGHLIICSGEHEEHRVDVMVNRLTKNGEENRAWKGIERVMNEYVSQAELMETPNNLAAADAAAQATKLTTNAKLQLNEYYGRDDQLSSSPRAKSNFFSRVEENRYAPGARFDLEGFIISKKPEIKKEEETGRLLLDMVIPGYQGAAMPMSFVVAKEAAEYVDDHYNVGNTVRVYGNMVNTVNVITTRKAGFAKAEESTQTTYVNELLIDNGEPEPYDEESPKAYDPEAIRSAMRYRENEYLPDLKKRQQENSKKNNADAPKAGFAAATGNAPKASTGFKW